MALSLSDTLVVPHVCENPRARLVIFPHSGGGPSAFLAWAEALEKERIELVAVLPPGREKRYGEKPHQDWTQLVDEVCSALQSSGVVNDVPYAFFGHSLGALMALETARALDETLAPGQPRPVHIFASGHASPSTARSSLAGSEDVALYKLPDAALLAAVSKFGVLPEEIVSDESLAEAVLPALRADFQIYAEYAPPPNRAPLAVSITAMGGKEDPVATVEQLRTWSEESNQALQGPEVFPGGHFYINSSRDAVIALVCRRVQETLDALPRSIVTSTMPTPPCDTPAHMTVLNQARKSPTAEAMIDTTETVTYEEMARRVELLAAKLQVEYLDSKGKQVVALLMPHDINYVISMLAIWKAAGVLLVIEAHFPADLCKELCEESGAVAALASPDFAAKFANVSGCKTLVMDRGCWDGEGALEPAQSPASFPETRPEDLSILMMTSGTTGKPKTIAGSFFFTTLGFQAKNVFAPYADDDNREAFQVMFVWEVMRPLMSGLTSILIPDHAALDPHLFVATLQKHKASRVLTTPSLLSSILQHCSQNLANRLASMRTWWMCGEVLPMQTALRMREVLPHVKLLNDYSTWESGDVSYATVNPAPAWAPSSVFAVAGYVAPEGCITILDPETKNVCPIGVPGEIYVGGKQISNGYHSHPDMTAQRFVPAPLLEMESACPDVKWYKSGDLGRFVGSPPMLEVRGRMDSTVKIRGFKVGMAVIEGTVAQVPGVSQCAVVPLYETPAAVDSLLCFLQPEDGVQLAPLVQRVKREVAQKLPRVFVPSFFKEMPSAVGGGEARKLDRKKLGKLFTLESLRASQAAEQPSNAQDVAQSAKMEEARQGMRAIVTTVWAKALNLNESMLSPDENFFDLGGHSTLAVKIASELSENYGLSITVLDIYSHATLGGLLEFLEGQQGSTSTSLALKERVVRGLAGGATTGVPRIGVVGLAGRFPGAPDANAFWKNLQTGAVSATFLSKELLRSKGTPEDMLAHKDFVPCAYMINDVDKFDHQFFGINRHEAAHMDPQHRVFIETTWEALENAALPPRSGLSDTVVGVFAAAGIDGYLVHHLDGMPLKNGMEPGDIFLAEIGNEKDYIATRVSYLLDFTGPSMNVNSACSSALVACVQGAAAIQSGQCDAAVAGASSITFPNLGYLYQDGLVASTDGYVRPFDAKAEGTVFGDAVGSVVLRRIEDIGENPAWGALRGFSVTNDGGQKAGYAAPSPTGQSQAVMNALQMSGLDPWSLSYVECHCTGTKVGDGIEVRGLLDAFKKTGGQKHRGETAPVALGSVKGNIAHANCAAGVTGLIKVLSMMQHKQLVPVACFEKLNPKIDLGGSPFFVNNELCSWDGRGQTLRAGVSSFGIGGTNAHCVLEEMPMAAPAGERPRERWSYHVLPLSGKSPGALRRSAAALAGALAESPDEDALSSAAYTMQQGRSHMPLRKAIVIPAAEGAAGLTMLDDENFPTEEDLDEQEEAQKRPAVAFVFPGQGSQYFDMARGLYEKVPLFRSATDRCCDLLKSDSHLGFDLRPTLFGSADASEREAEFSRPSVMQPSLFIVEYALSQVYLAAGLTPAAVAGHSLGEYTAAVNGGLLDLESAVAIVAARAKSTETLAEDGAMLSVAGWSEEELQAVEKGARPGLWLAAVNSPEHAVISGETDAVDALDEELKAASRKSTKLHVKKAFHSGLIAKAADTLKGMGMPKENGGILLPTASNFSGGWMNATQLSEGDYWTNHMRGTVRWRDNATKLLTQWRPSVVLEVGPGSALSVLTKKCVASGGTAPTFLQAMRHPKAKGTHDVAAFLESLAKMWEIGVDVDWSALHTTVLGSPEGAVPPLLRLPAYPFDRTSLWVNANRSVYVDQCDDPVPMTAVSSTTAVVPAQARNDRLLARFGERGDREPVVRAYCLPFASGGATVFAPWSAEQDSAVEVVAIELPGRGARSEERIPDSDEADEEMLEAVCAAILADLRGAQYVLVGFSMGAGLAVEIALKMAARQAPLPMAVYTAGRKPPAEDPESIHDITLNMTNEQLAGYAFTSPEVASSPEFTEIVVPLLRADLGIDARAEKRLSAAAKAGARLPAGVGFEVSCGTCDDVAPFAQAPDWQRYCDDRVGFHFYPGGHEFMLEQRPLIRETWRRDAVGRVVQRRTMEAAMLSMQGFSAPALPPAALGAFGLAAPAKEDKKSLPLYAVRWVEAAPASVETLAPGHLFLNLGQELDSSALQEALAAAKAGSTVVASCAPLPGVFSGQSNDMEVAQCWEFIKLVQHFLVEGGSGHLLVVCPTAASGSMVAGASKAVAMEMDELRVQRLFVPADCLPKASELAAELCAIAHRHPGETDLWVQDSELKGSAFSQRLDNILPPSHKLPCVPQRSPNGQLARYVLTGATGGLGKMVLQWLIKDQGLQPSQLVLLRRAGSAPLDGELGQCTTVEVSSVDSADDLMASGLRDLSNVMGMFHLAGILDDGIISGMTEERVRAVARPKCGMLIALLRTAAALGWPARWLLGFSSTSSLFGYAGQSNYCAANAILDQLSSFGAADVLPEGDRPPCRVVTVNWGPWAEAGMAKVGTKAYEAALAEGDTPLPTDAALGCLAAALRTASQAQPAATQFCACDVQWEKSQWSGLPILDLVWERPAEAKSEDKSESKKADSSADGASSQKLVEDFLVTNTKNGSTWKRVSGKSLHQLGLDSLEVVQLRNMFNKKFSVTVPLGVFADSTQTLGKLGEAIMPYVN